MTVPAKPGGPPPGEPAALAISTQMLRPPGDSLARIDSMDGTSWELVLHRLDRSNRMESHFRRLAREADGTNPFFDPRITLAALDRVLPGSVGLLAVWEILGEFPRVQMLIPVETSGGTPEMPRHLRATTHPFAPLGNPLTGARDAGETRLRFAQLLAQAFAGGLPPLAVPLATSATGSHPGMPDLAAIGEAASSGLCVQTVLTDRRACLRGSYDPGAKRKRELNRLWRKLGELGEPAFERAIETMDVLARFEEFLFLESRGWKGRKGTSLRILKQTAAFARQSVYEMSLTRQCEVHTLRLDGRAIASLVVFTSAGWYYPWKTAFLEEYSAVSPGLLLMDEASRRFAASRGFVGADSLAKPGGSWMDLLWKDQLATASCVITANPSDTQALASAIERRSRAAGLVKRLLRRG